jgi:acyl-CoA thioester hydrolase
MSDTPTIFSWPARVYFEDTDAGGVVYHANYLKFMERARTEWLRAMGWSQERLRTEVRTGFVVASMKLTYQRAARLDDSLLITLEVAERRKISVALAQKIISADNPSHIFLKAEVQIACVDLDSFRPKAIPDFFPPGAVPAA